MEQQQAIELTRLQRRDRLLQDVDEGLVTDMNGLDPRDTSAETLKEVRSKLQTLGHLARTNTLNRL